MTKLLQQCFLFFIVVVIPGHNLGNSQVSVYKTIGPTLVIKTVCFYGCTSSVCSLEYEMMVEFVHKITICGCACTRHLFSYAYGIKSFVMNAHIDY